MTTPRRILIVDDSSMMRMVIARYLDGSPFTVAGQAADGAEAVTRVRELLPDIVLMDVVMPGLNSLDALRAMLQVHPHLLVVMASSLGTQETVHDYLKAGAISFIQKPFTRDTLLDVLHHGLPRSVPLA